MINFSPVLFSGDEPSAPKFVLIWRLLSVLGTGAVIFFSLKFTYPFKYTISQIPYSDPLVHLFSFGALMYCFCQFFKQNHIRVIMGVGLVVLGIGLEILQSILWAGEFEFEDSFSNTLGVVLGYLFRNLGKY